MSDAILSDASDATSSSLLWKVSKQQSPLHQVAYPQTLGFDTSRDEEIMRCLEMVGLAKLATNSAGKLDLMHDEWNDVLSGGERQRVGFARLYFHRPTFAVLDEATSAINPDEEHRLYDKVR